LRRRLELQLSAFSFSPLIPPTLRQFGRALSTKQQVEDGKSVTSSAQPNWAS
jgi:hypothetical protein